MAAALRAQGLTVPASYLFTIGKEFRPFGPPRSVTPSVNHP
jgi:hypothetical protein